MTKQNNLNTDQSLIILLVKIIISGNIYLYKAMNSICMGVYRRSMWYRSYNRLLTALSCAAAVVEKTHNARSGEENVWCGTQIIFKPWSCKARPAQRENTRPSTLEASLINFFLIPVGARKGEESDLILSHEVKNIVQSIFKILPFITS